MNHKNIRYCFELLNKEIDIEIYKFIQKKNAVVLIPPNYVHAVENYGTSMSLSTNY